MVPNAPGDVLPLLGCRGVGGGPAQGVGGDHLHVQSFGEGKRHRCVAGVVGAALDMQDHGRVDRLGVSQRAVPGQPNHVVGRVGVQGAGEPGQHIVQRAAVHLHPGLGEDICQRVVGGLGAGSHHQPPDPASPPHTLDLAQDHRRPGQRQQDLAGQARGTHPGLKDGERHVRR